MTSLLDLSAELRDRIYHHVFAHDHPLQLTDTPKSYLAPRPLSCDNCPSLQTTDPLIRG